jgi:hypothetical protein
MLTAQEITSEIARLQDRLRIARNGLTNLNRNLQSNQAIIARYTEEVATIPGQVLTLQAQLTSVLPPASVGAIVGNAAAARDDRANSNLPPTGQQILTPTGRIESAGNGSGTNAVVTPTTESNPTAGTDAELRTTAGTDAELRTTAETQAIINNTRGQLVVAEDGSVSTLRRNPETGDLYDPGPNAAPVAGPGAGSSEDVGGTNPIKAVSPFPQYRARTQSYVFQANEVTSVFRQGRFEQVLKGTGYWQFTDSNTTQTNAQQRKETATTSFDGIPAGGSKVDIRKPTVGDLPVKQQAAIAAGTDPNTVNDQGMAFGGGGL